MNSSSLDGEERRTQEVNRLKSEFLATMGHDLRTPLNAIIGFADLMVEGKVGAVSDDHKEYLGDILSSARHLLRLLDGVVDFAKIESRPERSNLHGVVAESRDILHGLAASKRIRVTTHVDAAIAEVVIDASKLKHVIYGYLSNALKVAPVGCEVLIRVLPEGSDGFRLEIEDTGSQTAEATGDAGARELALADGIVEAEGGSAGVRSRPGMGRTFWAVLALSRRVAHAG